MFNTNFAIHVMEQSMSDQFLSRLIEGYVLIQKERYSEANDHLNRMLYSEHNPSDDDIIWIAKSHIYKKLGKQEESETCMKLVTDALENTPIVETRMYK
jgi:hypothetical protein